MTDDRENISEEIAALENEREKYVEAVSAGREALDSLDRVRAALRSAESVGLSDDLVSNFETTKVQIDQINLADDFAQLARRQLCGFLEQLSDMSLRIHVGYYAEEFSAVTDTLLGSFVSKNVMRVLMACGRTIAAVEATIAECERRMTDVETNIRTMIERRQRSTERE